MPSLRYYLKNATKNGKIRTDKVSILAKFTVDKEHRFEIRLGEKIEPKYWDAKNQKVKSQYRGHYELNEYLAQFEIDLLKLYRENRELSFEQFKLLAKNKQEKKTLFLALDLFLSHYKKEKDIKTWRKINTLHTQLLAFDEKYDFDLQTLDHNFYDAFKQFLYEIPNPNYRKYRLQYSEETGAYNLVKGDIGQIVGLFDDTVFKYIITLKTFLSWAEKRDYKVHHSYKSWEVISRKHEPISLTREELCRLEGQIFEWKSEDHARDYLLLQCRTGQRISDIKRFNLKDFIDNKWTFVPKKGSRLNNKQVTVHFKGFCAPALDIFQKHNWRMPNMSEQKINKHIKIACKLSGINRPVEYVRWAQNKKIVLTVPKYELLSNHSGRKTFITLSLQAGLPIEYVMELTGISKYDTIRHYRAKFEDEMIEKYLENIQEIKSVMKKAQ